MKVSVLIPTYNSGQYLTECLESVLNQDFRDMEILISDDGSTDNTLEIIKRFAARDNRIRWWQNPKNLGQLANHNALLHEARGEYIKILHSDDKLVSPVSIARMATVLDGNSEVSLVASACDLIDSYSHSRSDDRRNFLCAGIWHGKGVIRVSFEFEVAANYIGEPSLVMFRRAQAFSGFPKGCNQSLDTAMWFHLLEQGEFDYLPEPLCAYRQHSTQQGKINAQTGNGQNEKELLRLLETYWAKPWMGGRATQRMLNSQMRFLKKERAKFGSHASRADMLLAQMRAKTNPVARTFFWLEHKALRSFKKIRSAAIRSAFQRGNGVCF
jgi:glycosyltransferase involved in cell wall biosynthesis